MVGLGIPDSLASVTLSEAAGLVSAQSGVSIVAVIVVALLDTA